MIEDKIEFQEKRFLFPSNRFMDYSTMVMDFDKYLELIKDLWAHNRYLVKSNFPIKYKNKNEMYVFYCQEFNCKFKIVFSEMKEIKTFRLIEFNNWHYHRTIKD